MFIEEGVVNEEDGKHHGKLVVAKGCGKKCNNQLHTSQQ